MGTCSVSIRVGTTDVPAVMQPDSVSWEPPQQVGTDGESSPVYTPCWTCRLGFSKLTTVQYTQWYTLWDGNLQTIGLPNPYDGTLTDYECYVHAIRPRMSTQGGRVAAAGVDITLTRVYVELPDA